MFKRADNIFFIFLDIIAIGALIFVYQIYTTIWNDISQHVEQITYSSGDAYMLLGIIVPVVHLLFIPWFKKHEKIIVYGFTIYVLVGILITPRIFDYYFKNQLLENGYTYCGSKRNGSIRNIERIWMLDATCGEKLIKQDGNNK